MSAVQLLVGLGRALYGRVDSDTETLADLWMATVMLGMLGAMATYAALAAWNPELGGKFEGGITGTMIEHRVVWPIVAALLDLIALPFLVLVPLGTAGWLVRRVRQKLSAGQNRRGE